MSEQKLVPLHLLGLYLTGTPEFGPEDYEYNHCCKCGVDVIAGGIDHVGDKYNQRCCLKCWGPIKITFSGF